MALNNPFTARGVMVTDSNRFIGRKDDVIKIERRIINGKEHANLAIVAGKRMGGSSLAYYAISRHKAVLKQRQIIIVWASIGSFESPINLFSYIARVLAREARALDHYQPGLPSDWLDNNHSIDVVLHGLRDFVGELTRQHIKVIWVLDEFDKARVLFKGKAYLFQYLRDFGYHPDNGVSLVVISHWEIRAVEGQTACSPLDGIFGDRIYLKPFAAESLAEYYRQFGEVPITEAHKQRIDYYCGGWPYLMNVLCYEIFEQYQDTSEFDVDAAFEQVSETFTAHYQGIERFLREQHQFEGLVEMLLNRSTEHSQLFLRDLLRIGLIKTGTDKTQYQAFSDHFASYLAEVAGSSMKFESLMATLLRKCGVLYEWLEGVSPDQEAGLADLLKKSTFVDTLSLHLGFSRAVLSGKLSALNDLQRELLVAGRRFSMPQRDLDEAAAQAGDLVAHMTRLSEAKDHILVKRPTQFETSGQPTGIQKLVIKGYHELKSVELDLAAVPPWIFLTGENGYGKTLLLRAIVIALNGHKAKWGGGELADAQFNAGLDMSVKSRKCLHNIRSPFFTRFGHFAAYGPFRLATQHPETLDDAQIKSTATYSIFHHDGILLNIERTLLDLDKLHRTDGPKQQSATDKLDRLRRALLTLLHPYVTEIDTSDIQVTYRECAGDTPKLFGELASGVRSVIAMVGDIFIRLSTDTSDAPDELEGIVVIDELDLHLHPKWQKRLPESLSRVFPKIQFIASTHSPIPLLGSPPGSVFLKVLKDPEHGVILVDSDIPDIRRLHPNLILSSGVFDMDDIFHQDKDIDQVKTEDNWAEMQDNDTVKQRLAEKFRDMQARIEKGSK